MYKVQDSEGHDHRMTRHLTPQASRWTNGIDCRIKQQKTPFQLLSVFVCALLSHDCTEQSTHHLRRQLGLDQSLIIRVEDFPELFERLVYCRRVPQQH